MKTTLIISLICMSICIFSCKKEEVKKQEASDAVKTYFNLDSRSKQSTSFNTALKKTTEDTCDCHIIPLGTEDACHKINIIPGGCEDIYYPCSGHEGIIRSTVNSDCVFSTYGELYLPNKTSPTNSNIFTLNHHTIEATEFYYILSENSSEKSINEGYPDFYETRDCEVKYLKETDPNVSLQIYQKGNVSFDFGDRSFASVILEPIYHAMQVKDSIYTFNKTKGIEKVNYKMYGKSGEFTVNYGNGEFDSKAIITENGVSYEIDYKNCAHIAVL